MVPQRIEPRKLVEAKLFTSEDEAIQASLHQLLEDWPDLRIALAVRRYQTEDLSLGFAADIAGVFYLDMIRILEQHGVEPRFGPATAEEAQADLAAIKRLHHVHTD